MESEVQFDEAAGAALPGNPVRGSETGRPIMAALDLLGRRWTLRILWELSHEPEAPTFRELQERCGSMSSSVLASRLAELREAQIVTSADKGYRLTDLGRSLLDALSPLTAWSARWASAVVDEGPGSG